MGTTATARRPRRGLRRRRRLLRDLGVSHHEHRRPRDRRGSLPARPFLRTTRPAPRPGAPRDAHVDRPRRDRPHANRLRGVRSLRPGRPLLLLERGLLARVGLLRRRGRDQAAPTYMVAGGRRAVLPRVPAVPLPVPPSARTEVAVAKRRRLRRVLG